MKHFSLILRSLLAALCLAALVVVLVPSFNEYARNLLLPSKRTVLSTIRNDFFRDGRIIIIAKVKSEDWLYVEVYEQLVDGFQRTIDKIKLPDNQDGYFHYRGQATNLAIEDLDHDGQPEILAPTYDANHVAHLNVYKYNHVSKKFEVFQSED